MQSRRWLTTRTDNLMLPDFRVRQRDYLLEIARLLTQELDLEKLLERILRVAIEMLAGQAGLIALKEPEGWRVATAHRIQPAFLSYLEPLLGEEKVRELDVRELNRMLKELTYTATLGLLNSSVIRFSSCLQSFPGLGSFLMSRLFEPGGPSTGASASASVLPMKIQD